ncbi:unnamed protein product, partial [Chrysoparadoxa australica]
RAKDSVEERVQQLVDKMNQPERPPGPTIVYVTFQTTAAEVASQLAAAGINARHYHAGMSSEAREEVQGWFMNADHDASTAGEEDQPWPCVVATIAFGMGLDKHNVRYVYHFNVPKSAESYSQE